MSLVWHWFLFLWKQFLSKDNFVLTILWTSLVRLLSQKSIDGWRLTTVVVVIGLELVTSLMGVKIYSKTRFGRTTLSNKFCQKYLLSYKREVKNNMLLFFSLSYQDNSKFQLLWIPCEKTNIEYFLHYQQSLGDPHI